MSNKFNEDHCNLIYELKKVPWAVSFDGDASCQVLFPMVKNSEGRILRVGITDEDVGTGQLWWDYYGGI